VRAAKADGFALIDLIFVCGIIGLLASIAVPRMVLAKQAAGAASALGSMRSISSAELTFALTCGSGFYAPNLTTLGTPPAGSTEPFIGGGLGVADAVQRSGYQFQIAGAPYAGAPPSCNGLGAGETSQGFVAVAEPLDVTNVRYFGINASSALYEHTATMLGDMPEVGEPSAGHLLFR
jgi:type II secretory pathway pseudopilin PulG